MRSAKRLIFLTIKAAKYTRNIIIPSPSHTKSSAKENGKHEKDFYFSGSSRINYLLPKRYTRHIPSPLYRCPGKGLIVIDIWVNQSGTVEKASVNDSKSTPDQCLIDVALESAFKTRFNSNYSTDLLEKGHISYKF